MPAMLASVLSPSRRMLAESSCTSARELVPVEILSLLTMGWLSAAVAQSPESPRWVETSPCVKLMRATLDEGSDCACSCGRAGPCSNPGISSDTWAPAITLAPKTSVPMMNANLFFMAPPLAREKLAPNRHCRCRAKRLLDNLGKDFIISRLGMAICGTRGRRTCPGRGQPEVVVFSHQVEIRWRTGGTPVLYHTKIATIYSCSSFSGSSPMPIFESR